MTILITGSAGYIGSFLVRRFLREPKVSSVIGIDLLPPPPDRIPNTPPKGKLSWIVHDLAKDGWQDQVKKHGLMDVVVHSAFKIRNPFGQIQATEKNNLEASYNVFEFCFKNNISKLIYFSSVAAYSARPENIGRLLTESDELKERTSPYGSQKRKVEGLLEGFLWEERPATEGIVMRLGSITGPYGQRIASKFSLINFLTKILPFVVEAHPAWARQFTHETDLEQAVVTLAMRPPKPRTYTIYNFAPQQFLTARDIARILKKPVLRIPPWLVRITFWITWHLGFGILPTPSGSASSLIYPINVDGSKIGKEAGFSYRFRGEDALLARSTTP